MKETFWEQMAEEEKNPKIYYIACLKLLKEKKLKRVPIVTNMRLFGYWAFEDVIELGRSCKELG